MPPVSWRYALGSGDKTVAENEKETVIIQRRCLRAARDLKAGEIAYPRDDRCTASGNPGAILPSASSQVIGTRLVNDIPSGKELTWMDLGK